MITQEFRLVTNSIRSAVGVNEQLSQVRRLTNLTRERWIPRRWVP